MRRLSECTLSETGTPLEPVFSRRWFAKLVEPEPEYKSNREEGKARVQSLRAATPSSYNIDEVPRPVTAIQPP